MSLVADKIDSSLQGTPRRRVSIRRDDNDFIVAFQPENLTVFRNEDASALRKSLSSVAVGNRSGRRRPRVVIAGPV